MLNYELRGKSKEDMINYAVNDLFDSFYNGVYGILELKEMLIITLTKVIKEGYRDDLY